MKGFIPFPEGMRPKVSVIAQVEFEHAFYEATVQYISNNTPLKIFDAAKN